MNTRASASASRGDGARASTSITMPSLRTSMRSRRASAVVSSCSAPIVCAKTASRCSSATRASGVSGPFSGASSAARDS